jgi:hypothetical protein
MGRQILAVMVGIALSFLASAVGGYLLYRLPETSGHQLGMLVRYVLNPVIAVVVGTCVGVLAKSLPGTLGALSLMPWALGFVFYRRQSLEHGSLIVLLGILDVVVGIVAAKIAFRMRTGASPAR